MAERDRDEFGRARSARPRDRLGRPLPRGSRGVTGLPDPDDLDLAPPQALEYAQRLLDDGLAFYAHEVLEAAWKSRPDEERLFWQGLAQVAVGVTHIQRGNAKGAITLLDRAAWRLSRYRGPACYGVDIAGLLDYAAALIADLDAGAEIAPPRLRPRLVG